MILTDPESVETRAELTAVVDALVRKVSPLHEAVQRADAMTAGWADERLWERLVGDLGAVGLTASEDLGGSGASVAEMAVFAEAGGRHLMSVPLIGAWLGLEALVRCGCEDRGLLVELAAGRQSAVLALPHRPLAVESGVDGPMVSGHLDLVLDVGQADHLVVPGRRDGADLWCVVPRSAVVVTVHQALDLTRSFGSAILEHSPVTALVPVARIEAAPTALRDLARLMLACEQLGVAEQALSDAVAYASERRQFGRVIGSFQAIKHLAADMATATDLARSLVEHAIWTAVERPTDLEEAAAMALTMASDAAVHVTAENVQIHGGIGFSWEHTAHLYYRKARSNAVLLGDRYDLAESVIGANRTLSMA